MAGRLVNVKLVGILEIDNKCPDPDLSSSGLVAVCTNRKGCDLIYSKPGSITPNRMNGQVGRTDQAIAGKLSIL